MPVQMTRKPLIIPTYVPGTPNELPFFLEKKAYQGATGRVYPLPYTDKLSNQAVDKAYDAVTLENEYIEVVLLPELGGKIHGAKAKHNGYEFIYQNTVIKPAMVGLAGPWVSGGVEFNWPQHHRPTTFMPTEATLQTHPDGSKTCWMGEAEPFHRMRGTVGITVYPGSSIVEAKAVVYNRTDAPLPFMWWNNLAVRVHPRYKATFPPDVEYGNDHDRRAVISFPVMKGVFHTARPFDYGEGTDATWFSNIKLPTSVMVMRGQSRMDFLGGYDFAANAGTVTVSDHHYSVGKKMWTWGDGDFGRAWCQNLTDNGDRYIELMTGVFTDNQPDFTYIMPGEMKTFKQVWYPISGIGEAKNATREAALSLAVKDGTLNAGAITTSARPGARLVVTVRGKTIFEETCDLSPQQHILRTVPLPEGTVETEVRAALFSREGEELAAYQPVPKGRKQPPKARSIPPEPKDVASLEELYLHGAHLEQYKHHTYDPEDYYREALRRDPGDLRCNHAMGRLFTEKGDFETARMYLERAVKRLKMRNDNPADPQPVYDLARLLRLQGQIDQAYDLYADASWQYGLRSACLYEMACIDCLKGRRDMAVEKLRLCLETNIHHFAAGTLLGYLTGDTGRIGAVLALSPQDAYARFARFLLTGEPAGDFLLSRPEDVIDAALDFKRAGLISEAVRVLNACTAPSQMILYHLAALTGEQPRSMALALCFPNRLEDISVLSREAWQAAYLLGCLYYDRMNYQAAADAWEKAAALHPHDAFTYRNLAQAYFDHLGRREDAKASLEKALRLAPQNARILYELLQLYKNTGVSVKDRLALLESHEALVRERDDCYLDYIILYTQDGQYERARELLLSKRFNIYEGGEGKLTRHHGWLYTLLGRAAHLAGDTEKALDWYQTALVYPANYGEGRHYSAQEGNIYYCTGLALEAAGQKEQAEQAYQKAAGQPDQVTEISYFAGLAYGRLNDAQKAEKVFQAMMDTAAQKEKTAHLYGYFGVGMAAPLPFELDVRRLNLADAFLLKALGAKGLKEEAASLEAVKALEALDPYNAKLGFFKKLDIL